MVDPTRAVEIPPVVRRRFEAVVLDWDGTAVPDRDADASMVRELFEKLSAAAIDVFIVSGTHVGNIDGQLAARPRGPGRLVLCLNRGSEVFAVGTDGPDLVHRRCATPQEDAALTLAAERTVQALAARGLRAEIVTQRLNRRKIDLIPEPDWLDPPKARIAELLDAVTARLGACGIGLRDAVEIARSVASDAGIAAPRVTTDVKHVEIGLTDKSDSARWVYDDLWRRGIWPSEVLIAGDEFGPLGGMPGSDSLLLIDQFADSTVFSVGVEPEGVPAAVLHVRGGPPRFMEIMTGQLTRREAATLSPVRPDPAWSLTIDGVDDERERAHGVILSMADGTIGTSGAPSYRHPAASPQVFASGVYRGSGRETQLAECPVWTDLPFNLTDRMTIRRVLEMRTGLLHQQITTEQGDVSIVVAFSDLARPGTAVMRVVAPQGLVPIVVGDRYQRVSDANVDLEVAGSDCRTISGLDRAVCYARQGSPPASVALQEATDAGFDSLLAEHRAKWASRWEEADIAIVGDPEMQHAVRFALFHLMGQVADLGETALGARGMTGPGYGGHVFWDADVFALPFFAATHPAAARTMLEYRLRRLPVAMAAAQRRGRLGARFPWESADDGFDVTPTVAHDHAGRVVPIRTAENEEHIVADIAWAADQYVLWTGDEAFASGPGRELWIETARYWASRVRRIDDAGHIYGVIGPDEYHDPVDDNAFTNVMARWNLRRAAAAAGDAVDDSERRTWLELADALVDGYDASTGVYEQFSGFARLEPLFLDDVGVARPVAADVRLGRTRVQAAQIIKQADVLMLHLLVPNEVEAGSLEVNLDYYEPRTAHGSSLSPGVHAALFARAGRPDEGLDLLRKAARIDLDDVTRATAAGLHIAAMGTVWQTMVMGYAGIRPEGDVLRIDPHLPSSWDELDVRVRFHGTPVRVRIGRSDVHVSSPEPVRFEVAS